jgi:hypothetical protein
MADSRLTPNDRRRILEQLSRDRLSELTTRFELEVEDRRATRSHVDAIIRKRSLDFRRVLEVLKRDELAAACDALALGAGSRDDKATLVDRLLRIEARQPRSSRRGAPSGRRASTAELMPATPAAASSDDSSSTSEPPPVSVRGGSAVKSLLRRFVHDLAGGSRGRDAANEFTTKLLKAFGWPDGRPDGATMPATLSIVADGARTTRTVPLHWEARRVLLEVVKHDVMLDFAWKDLLKVCLQVSPQPHYVVLTNQRDLHLYDLGRDRSAPRLSIAVDDLPKYSEAFPFFAPMWSPGVTPKIVDVSRVSREVAELVARLYRSLVEQHPKREKDVVQFTLQCILTMFAEDIGLLPKEHFSSLLYEGARHRDVEKRLAELFRLMSTRDVPGRTVPYFNGGLFTDAVTLPLGPAQLQALTKASEANWTYVDPHIFGSVFQGIMDDAERHKSGAHYTAHDDIMRVVGPTIVEPWRKRIREATTLAALLEVRDALLKFRVLDPACGSGNFLYVAFRELYKLDTELLSRIVQYRSTQTETKAKVTWGAGIQTSNFYGIDINPFAVELAKVTLNIAKKIAFDERRETAADLVGQLELDVDPSLPLDNLDRNIVCADALFTEWPEVDAIVGNPPFLGDRKMRGELGAEYVRRIQDISGVDGLVDLCCYWFRRAHDRLPQGGRAGLVGTSGIRVGKAREASLDYVVADGGTITNAVSSRLWPGEAALNVSMVSWTKGHAEGPHQLLIGDDVVPVSCIPTHLQLHADVSGARALQANSDGTAMGVIFGSDAFLLDVSAFRDKLRSTRVLRPVAAGTALLTGTLQVSPEYCAFFGDQESESAAERMGGAVFAQLKAQLLPEVRSKQATYDGWLARWWQPWRPRAELFRSVAFKSRMVACSNPQARPVFVFLSAAFVPTNTLQLFTFEDDYSFGILQSGLHWAWTKAKGGKVRADIRYTNDVWKTFPWPQEPSEAEVVAVAEAARNLRAVRDRLMKENGWSLRALHQAAEVAGPHPLKNAQAALDDAVRAAYAMPADQEATEFLLELNKLVAEDEAAGHPVQGPGVPRGIDPKDPRLMSTDCIEPPPLQDGST